MNKIFKKNKGANSSLSFNFFFEKFIIFILSSTFLLFILYPTFRVVLRSLTHEDAWSLYHYKNLITPRNLELIRNSIFVASLSSIIATILAFSIGLFAYFNGPILRKRIYQGLMMTMISPPFISAIALITLFGRRGLISYGIFGLTLNPYGWHGIVLLQSLSGVSLSAMMIITGFKQLDNRLILASRDLGASSWQTLKNIIIPCMIPTIISVLFLQFTMNISDFTTPIIVGGRFRVLATEAYLQVYAQGNLNGAAAMAMLLLIPSIIAFYFYRKNMTKAQTLSERTKTLDRESISFKLPRTLQYITAIITIVFFLMNLVQYSNIFITAFSRNISGSLVFTLDHWQVFQSRHIDALIRTIYMSVISGIFATILGMLLSYYHQRRNVKGFGILEFIGSMPYIIPGIFFGLSYIVAFHRGPITLTGTLLILILNCTFRHVSVGNKAANAAFENMDYKLEWASNDLGASKLKTLTTVVFPMLRPVFLVSFINTFTACMTTVGPLMLLVSPRNLVTSVLMFNEINSGRYGQGAVMGSLLILITFSINLFAIFILNREKRY